MEFHCAYDNRTDMPLVQIVKKPVVRVRETPGDSETIYNHLREHGQFMSRHLPMQPTEVSAPCTMGLDVRAFGIAPNNSVAQKLRCAAKYGSNPSIASMLGLGNNYVANLFGSNSVSGLINLGNSVFGNGRPPDFAKMALGGASLGLPINNIRTFTGGGSITGLNGATGYVRSQALQGIFNAATESGAIPSIAAEGGQLAAQGGLTAGEFASGVGIAKFALDLGTVLVGYYACSQ